MGVLADVEGRIQREAAPAAPYDKAQYDGDSSHSASLAAVSEFPILNTVWRCFYEYSRSILYFRMRDCRVVRFNPSRSRRAVRPADLSSCLLQRLQYARAVSVIRVRRHPKAAASQRDGRRRPNSDIGTRSPGPLLRITDRSMTFCNSRILPGQS